MLVNDLRLPLNDVVFIKTACRRLFPALLYRNKRVSLKPGGARRGLPAHNRIRSPFSILLPELIYLCSAALSFISLSSEERVSSLNALFIRTHHGLLPFHVFNLRLCFLCSSLFRVEVVSNPDFSPYPLYNSSCLFAPFSFHSQYEDY